MLCKCGCGERVKKSTSSFCSGHNSRGRVLSATHKERIGAANAKPKLQKICKVCEAIFQVKNYRVEACYCSASCRSKGEYHKSVANGFGSRPGDTPWNKGKKIGFVPVGAFRKGNVPWNAGTKKGKSTNERISSAISCAVRRMAKGKKNSTKWQNIVGWGLDEFRPHIEKTFKEGMFWENHGSVWHIDHIVPITAFNITSIHCLDFKRCWALSNLQALFVAENVRKRNKMEKPFQPCLGIE